MSMQTNRVGALKAHFSSFFFGQLRGCSLPPSPPWLRYWF